MAILRTVIIMDAALDNKQWQRAFAARQEGKALKAARDKRQLAIDEAVKDVIAQHDRYGPMQ